MLVLFLCLICGRDGDPGWIHKNEPTLSAFSVDPGWICGNCLLCILSFSFYFILLFSVPSLCPCLYVFFSVEAEHATCAWSLSVVTRVAGYSLGYSVIAFPTTHHPTQFDRVSFKHTSRQVSCDVNVRAGDWVTFVDGLITKTPTQAEILARAAIPLADVPWFVVPLVLREDQVPKRGCGLGSCVAQSRSSKTANSAFAHLLEESDRVWLRCRETDAFHLVRGIGVVAIKSMSAKTCIRTRNQMVHVESMSTHDRARLQSRALETSHVPFRAHAPIPRNEHGVNPVPNPESAFANQNQSHGDAEAGQQASGVEIEAILMRHEEDIPTDLDQTELKVPEPIQFTSPRALNLLKSTTLLIRSSAGHFDGDEPHAQHQVSGTSSRESSDGGDEAAPEDQNFVADTVRSWSHCGVSGLKMLTRVDSVAERVLRLCRHFFDPPSFRPKPGLVWLNLFGQEVVPVTFEGARDEFRASARASVPLLDWASGKYSRQMPFPEGALADLEAVKELATTVLMPALGFPASGARYKVEGMSFLLQTPAGGISQALHTDDDPHADIGEWVSILLPCHDQRGTVFLQKDRHDGFEAPHGVKPFATLGDVLAWNRVAHMGSACSDVPPEIELRVALFVFIHVIRDRLYEPPPESGFAHANRDSDDEEIIHFGPDYNFWRSGAFPIIRVCAVCRHGVSSSIAPFQEPRCPPDVQNHLLYCSACLDAPGSEVMDCLVCPWCRGMGALDIAARYPHLDCDSEFATATDYVYQCLLEERTCLHGVTKFRPLPFHEYIFVLFSVSELQAGCRFWLSFFAGHDFSDRGSPFSPAEQSSLWAKFCSAFLANRSCSRARVLCWLSGALGGIGSVFNAKAKLSFGNYPVFYGPSHYNSQSAVNSSRLAMLAWRDACDGKFHEKRLLKVTRRAHRIIQKYYGEMTLRCSCLERDVAGGLHHVVEECLGPILCNEAQPDQTLETDEPRRCFMQRCRESWDLS